ncbi:hypothetical protein [Streptomyces sp. NPDC001054]
MLSSLLHVLDVQVLLGEVAKTSLVGLPWAGAAALGVGAAYAWARRRAARAVKDRVVVEFVPSDDFDPSLVEIERHASRLARVQEPSGWLLRRARAVRIRLTSEDGELVYRVEGPRRAEALLRMPGFAQVECAVPHVAGSVKPVVFEGVPPLRRQEGAA